jgi:hypothetical protein
MVLSLIKNVLIVCCDIHTERFHNKTSNFSNCLSDNCVTYFLLVYADIDALLYVGINIWTNILVSLY